MALAREAIADLAIGENYSDKQMKGITTLAAVQIRGNWLEKVHAGDSQIFVIRNGEILFASKGHTIFQEVLDIKVETISEEDMETVSQYISSYSPAAAKKLLTNALGFQGPARIDLGLVDINASRVTIGEDGHLYLPEGESYVFTSSVFLQEGDWIFIRTDGVNLPLSKIMDILNDAKNAEQATREMEKSVLAGPAEDNLSIILYRHKE
ncbi:MAG: hypothetical protein FD145_172 [Candidatus Saganbacteria bacterium]|uniref:PPM-type phosphatase domain-containing protein n=1 Tax=Candidatus Saganbacteria bacterium TaxID=2575572 RepID=A0A833P3Q8_UNCSA|nr:MAG: hypothetical protein FD145_172 [Candidatus Saganbacteria bacterium]